MTHGWTWKSRPGYKPVLILAAAIVFITLAIMPPTQAMLDMVSKENPSGYQLGKSCKTIVDTVNQKLRPDAYKVAQNGQAAVQRVTTVTESKPCLRRTKSPGWPR